MTYARADQAVEVARLESLGADPVDVGQGADVSWVVMADPDGIEFCVLRAFTPDEPSEIAEEATSQRNSRTSNGEPPVARRR